MTTASTTQEPRGGDPPVRVIDAVRPVLRVVGRVRSPHASPGQMPGEGVVAQVIVEPEYVEALEGIEVSSHVIVVGWLHQAGHDPAGSGSTRRHTAGPPRGAFATRCPGRPNPVSITTARLITRTGAELHFDRLDLVDGTPVVDLKPYIPGEDSVFCATRERRLPHAPSSPVVLAGFLEPILERHLGPDARAREARVALLAVLRAIARFGVDPRSRGLRVAVNQIGVATDALMALTGATFCSGRLTATPGEATLCFRFALGGEELTLVDAGLDESLLAESPLLVDAALREVH